MNVDHLLENSLFTTRLGDFAKFPYRKAEAHFQAINYLLLLHKDHERSWTTAATLEFLKQLCQGIVFSLLSVAWLIVVFSVAVLDIFQISTIQTFRESNFNKMMKKFSDDHQREIDRPKQVVTELREQYIKDLIACGTDELNSVRNLSLLLEQRKYYYPSLAHYTAERDDIYQGFQKLRKQYTVANYANRPWDNQQFLAELNVLFIRALANTDELIRLIELSYFDNNISPTVFHMAKSIGNDPDTADAHKFHPNEGLHFAYMAFILNFTEEVSSLSTIQESMHHRFNFPVDKSYLLKDREYHAHWIRLYNVLINRGINEYYHTDNQNFAQVIATICPQKAKYFLPVNPRTFCFEPLYKDQKEHLEENPHQHIPRQDCLKEACQILRIGQGEEMTTRDFAREGNYHWLSKMPL